MKHIYCFTSAACNYLPKARLLAQSLRVHHPEIRRVLALSDQVPAGLSLADSGWDEILPIDALGIPQWRRWAFAHDIVELSTAIKPFVLSMLLKRPDCKGVLYLDPDIVLFSKVDDLIANFDHSDVLLTPHQTIPEATQERVVDNEICSLKHGVYNLGFIGVRPSPQGMAFAQWWADRVYHYCRNDIPNGLFTDQRWIDLAPAFFPGTQIIRSPRFNVAPWNLTTRRLSGNQHDGYRVEGEPLGFYHFTGFDSGAHRVMARKHGPKNASVQELVGWYERSIAPLDQDPLSRVHWAFGRFSNGAPINRAHRVIYRTRPDLQRAFPDPFETGRHGWSGYLGWCRLVGRFEYPRFLPAPARTADWASLGTPPLPTLAEDGERAEISLIGHLRLAMNDPEHKTRLSEQVRRVLKVEGYPGLWRRVRRLLF